MSDSTSHQRVVLEQPDRSEILGHSRLTIVNNAIALTLLARVRDVSTAYREFGSAAHQLANLVFLESCRDLALKDTTVQNFAGEPVNVHQLLERIAGVAILRAGLIFEPSFRDLFPAAPLYHIGIKRDEKSLAPTVYASNIPVGNANADRVFILDPMLATGGTACKAIEIVRQSFGGPIDLLCLVAAPLGVQQALAADPNCRVYTAAFDEKLNEFGYIVPGLGDAGDRHFGTLDQ